MGNKVRIRDFFLLLIFLSGWLSSFAQSTGDYVSLAKTHYENREYPKAVRYFNSALGSLEELDSTYDPIREEILSLYTNALILIGSYDLADSILSPSKYAHNYKLLNNRATALGYKGDYSQALDIFASIIKLPDLPSDMPGRIYQNIGFIQMDMGMYDDAATHLQYAVNNLNGINIPIAKSNLAICYAYLGYFKEAINLIDSAINTIKSSYPSDVEDYTICLRKKAEIYSIFNLPHKSYQVFYQYFNLEKNHLIHNLESLSHTDRLNLWLKEKPQLSKCFLIESYSPEFLYEVAIFRRQTSLLGMHDTENLRSLLSTNANDVRRSLKDNEAAIEFISYTALNGQSTYAAIILPKRDKARFVKLFDESFIYEPEVVGANSLINAVRRNDPMDKNLLYTDTSIANKIWAPIINALPGNTTTIYFAPEGILHFIGIENMPFDGNKRFEIHRVTSTSSLTDRNRNKDCHHKRTLLIGGLDYSSLPEDSISDTYSHEASDLLRQKAGNTNLFQYLPGTRSEVDSINSILDDATTTYQIGEADLKQRMPRFDMIHIATHGYSLNLGIRKRSEFSVDSLAYDMSLNATGLALSGANIASLFTDREDGLLSAREICDLDLSNVDFVILSACQTAQGDITDEGAAGLVRGLKNAGVNTVIATLWSVDDKSTMLFMQEFYRLINKGISKHEAYIGAQNFLKAYEHRVPTWKFSPSTLARERETKYNTIKYDAPHYWAPFIIIDDF